MTSDSESERVDGRTYESGAQKRKRAKEKKEEDEKQGKSLLKWLGKSSKKKQKENNDSRHVDTVSEHSSDSASRSTNQNAAQKVPEDVMPNTSSLQKVSFQEERIDEDESDDERAALDNSSLLDQSLPEDVVNESKLNETFHVNDPASWPDYFTDKQREYILDVYPMQTNFNFENLRVVDGERKCFFQREHLTQMVLS